MVSLVDGKRVWWENGCPTGRGGSLGLLLPIEKEIDIDLYFIYVGVDVINTHYLSPNRISQFQTSIFSAVDLSFPCRRITTAASTDLDR